MKKNKFYSKFNDSCAGNVFVTLQGLSQFTGQTYINLEIGVKSTNPNIQQNTRYRGVHKWGGTECDPRYVSLDSKATFDAYSQAGNMNASLIGYNLDPRSLIDSYIKTWTFSDKKSCGGYDASYGGRKFNSKNYSTTNKFSDDYLIVPSTAMPSGDHNFVIVHRLPDEQLSPSQKNPSSPQIVGYAHSIRLNVIDRHDVAVGTIQLPVTMQSGSTYSITVPVVNNGDVNESNVSLNLNISNGSGYNQLFTQSVSVNKGATVNIPFTWNTLGLSPGTYYFTASVMIADDISPTNDTTSDQKNLLPPPSLSIVGDTNKNEYGEGEIITLNISVKDDLQTPVSGASVSYKVKKAGEELSVGVAKDQGNGSYFAQFGALYIPGNYSIEINASKIGYLSGLNNSITFLVKDTIKPTIPILYYPGNNAFIYTTQITFDWSDSFDSGSGISRYNIQASKNIDFATSEVDLQPIASNYSAALNPGTYYWRVRSIDNANNQSDWSVVSKFTIDTEAPSIQITNPTSNSTYSTNESTITIEGTASDNIGVTAITWANNRGGSGIASGTSPWSVDGINLLIGDNIITVTARDAAGNIGTDTLTVTYTPPTLIAPTLSSPANGVPGQPTSLNLQWVDTNSSPQEQGYRIRIKPSGGSYTSYTTGQNVTSYPLSGLLYGTTYYWNVQAIGNGTSTLDSAWANSGTDWSFTVLASQSFPFSDGFSTDKGWVGYENGGWERRPASAGGGENGNPDPATDHSPSSDNYILGFAIGGDYPNNLVEKSVISPPINCTGQTEVYLKFWRYLNVGSNYYDHAKVYVSNDGTNWIQLWENPVFDLTDNQWTQVVFDISAIAANQATVYIKFTMGPTNSSGRFSGWNIDDLEVTSEILPAGSVVDFDGDGKTDIAVYRTNIGAWYIKPSSGTTPYGVGWGGDSTDKPTPGDYDGDGKTDIAVYRAATGAWYIKPSSGASPYGVGWGGDSTDKPTPGDYDGDGKTDIAVYRVNSGAWYIKPSSGATPYGVGWGGDSTDKPTPGDYDGDGKTDIAVYRGVTGAWYIKPSGGGSPYGVGWGGDSTDKPTPGDYDGDGKTDIAVYRAATGAWYIYPSSGASPYGVGWGGDSTDKPTPGDYDGDGKTDIAVYRVNSGAWYIKPSSGASPYGVGWGGDSTDKPVPGDYDGDGKIDIAVYRVNSGAWYIKPSSGATPYGVGWGGDSTDKPTPGDYDGDGKTDIAVYRGVTGAWYIKPSGGGSPYGVGWGGDSTDKPTPGDYDGDGKTDIAVYRGGTGAWYIYPSGGGSPYGVGWGGDPSDIPVTMNLSSIE